MAINRQDYKCIYNSFSKTQNKETTNELGIGSVVKNLVVDLNEENIYNPNFPDYYGTDGNLQNKWCCATEENISKSKVVNSQSSTPVSGSADYGPFLTLVKAPTSTSFGTFSHTFSRTIRKKLNKDDITVTANGEPSMAWSYNRESGQFSFNYQSGSSTPIEIRISCSFVDYYIHTWSGEDIGYTGSNNSLATSSSDNGIFSITWQSPSSSATITLYYTINGSTKQEETIQKGLLQHQVTLEANTSYVLQVVNMTSPKGHTLPKNQIIGSEFSYEFDQYLFFQTGNQIENCDLSIYGVSFGYKTFGRKVNDNDDVIFFQLRNFEAPVQAKVYLFKSNMPWIINQKGIIVGLKEHTLLCQQEVVDEGLSATLTDKEIQSMFRTAPVLQIANSGKTLNIQLPGGVVYGDNKWKHKEMWDYTYKTNKTDIMDNLCLIVARNYLTEEVRDYSRGFYISKYGLLRTIQRTKTSSQDQYSNADNEIKTYSFTIKPMKILYGDNKHEPIQLVWDETFTQLDNTTVFNLPILSLLGYNYTYSKMADRGISNYKYTSVSFAWATCYDGKISIISDYSIPLIVDRQAVLITSQNKDTGKSTIEYKPNCKLVELLNSEYYSGKAIFLE